MEGSLKSGSQIVCHGDIVSDTALISINYGGGALFSWEPNAPVDLEHGTEPDEVFYETAPDRRIWGVSGCRGDLNGVDDVSFDDLTGLVAGIASPIDYSIMYPGLGGTWADTYLSGSREWHGDANCDSDLTYYDLNAFVSAVADADCQCKDNSLPAAAPERTAADLEANIAPEWHDAMVNLVYLIVDNATSQAEHDYWSAVYDILTE